MAVEVRRIRSGEGAVLWAIRLRALADAPSAFGSTHAEESRRPTSDWDATARRSSAGRSVATFFAVDGTGVVGLIGAYRPDAASDDVELVSMWTAPDVRRSGVASALVEAVLAWASQTGAARVSLWVTRGNDGAAKLYERHGFVLTGDHKPLPSDPCKDELRMTQAVGSEAGFAHDNRHPFFSDP